MKILYDHQIFNIQQYGGISRYFSEIINTFHLGTSKYNVTVDFSLRYSDNHYLTNASFSTHKQFMKNRFFKGLRRHFNKKRSQVNIAHSVNALRSGQFDIFHPTYYDTYFLEHIGNKPFVLTIYDMIHELFPGSNHASDKSIERKKELARKAAKIIAISENTKIDIMKFYNIGSDKISTVYLGPPTLSESDLNKHVATTPERFILFVGNRGGYKNFDTFISAITPLLSEDKNLYLICAGGGSFSSDNREVFEKLRVKDKTIQLPVNDDTLACLYSRALAFVFPSLYEGFGLPILEAFTYGCPVLLSNSSSFPEVAGKAGIYFEPTEKDSIRSEVGKILYDKDILNDYKLKGYEQLAKFSWDKTAESTNQVYASILT